MSSQLLSIFIPQSPVQLADDVEGDQPKSLWKVVLRTGTWKLRPGPGGVKLNAPLKVYRDKAPKGHISLSSLKKNFDAGAKENVTIPTVHADGTTSDSGFVRELRIQDVMGEDGSKAKESLLWARMEITEPDIMGKIERKSLVGVSGGILFDYERTEDAQKFDQILSHVMVTNSPWINGTGGFTNELPEGVMAAEPDDLPTGEAELETAELDAPVPGTSSAPGKPPSTSENPGTVVWKPEEGLQFKRDLIQRALREWRDSLLRPMGTHCADLDMPYYHCEDVADGDKALIRAGYGSESEAWVVGFKHSDDGQVEIDPFTNWTPAKQEWVAAAEQEPSEPGPREGKPRRRVVRLSETPLRRAQRERDDRVRNGGSSTTTNGGSMKLSQLEELGVELSEEQKAALAVEEQRDSDRDAQLNKLLQDQRKGKASALLSEIKDTPLDTPGVKKYIESIVTSDDGGTALEFSEETDSGARTQPVAKTATEIVEGLFAALPRNEEGKLTLSQQARNLPDDKKPDEKPEGGEDDKRTPSEKADALAAEFAEQGLGSDLNLSVSSNGGGS